MPSKKGRTGLIRQKVECGQEISRLEEAYLRLRDQKEAAEDENDVAYYNLKKMGLKVSFNVPYILLIANVLGLIVLLVAIWLPKGEMPYTPLALAFPLVSGILTAIYHFVNRDAPAIKYGAVGSVFTIAALMGLSAKYPPKVHKPCETQ